MTKQIRITLLTLTIIFLTLPGLGFAATYTIDPDHSNVGFKVKHLAISTVSGRFAEFSGEFTYDPANIGASKAEVTINATSIDTRSKKRDDHLRTGDFFDATKFPELKFVSKEIKDPTASGFTLLGDLTIRGVTKPVSFNVVSGGSVKDMYGKERTAFTASSTINRKDFGVSWSKILDNGALVVGEEVTVELEVEGVKKDA